jgi:hypothetical protein
MLEVDTDIRYRKMALWLCAAFFLFLIIDVMAPGQGFKGSWSLNNVLNNLFYYASAYLLVFLTFGFIYKLRMEEVYVSSFTAPMIYFFIKGIAMSYLLMTGVWRLEELHPGLTDMFDFWVLYLGYIIFYILFTVFCAMAFSLWGRYLRMKFDNMRKKTLDESGDDD